MKLALTELRRRPNRFLVAAAILSVVATLLVVLGGLLDGLIASSTGAYRAQQADLIVYSSGAEQSLVRSRVTAQVRDAVASVEGVDAVGGLSVLQLGARRASEPDARHLIGTALFGYELAPRGVPATPPAAGEVVADDSLRAEGVHVGDTLLFGPDRTPLVVSGFVADTKYAGQISLWASMDTWRDAVARNRPDRTLGDGTAAALVVTTDGDAHQLADAIDTATGGVSEAMTIDAAIEKLPGVAEQRATVARILGVTALVAVLVVALFFSLITLERQSLYGTLKAIGASSWSLFAGVLAQAIAIAVAASVFATLVGVVLEAALPPGVLPYQLFVGRIVTSVAIILVASAAGSVFSLRRVLRADPAESIGADV